MSNDISPKNSNDSTAPTAFLVLDTESVPDGQLLRLVQYAGEDVTPEEAVARAQAEARASSPTQSDFLPVTFQYPIAVCVARVGADYRLQRITCLDAPHFRPRQIVESFWDGVGRLPQARLVTFNGRGFDMPLLELAAFRFGCTSQEYFRAGRNRFGGRHLDLMEWLTNHGGYRMKGGLNLLSKLLGKPGKTGITGDQVYDLYRAGKIQEINDYCLADTLDTYFVFLRTRVLTGEISLEKEIELVRLAKEWTTTKAVEVPALQKYLNEWGDWEPWP